MPTPDKEAHVRDAIAVMTAWLAEPDGGPLVLDTIERTVEASSDDAAGLLDLIGGLVSLCGFLLVRRENETGVRPAATLQEYGRRFAG